MAGNGSSRLIAVSRGRWGISATIERFRAAMGEVTARTLYEPVEVALDRVRASGMVKDRIELFEPDKTGTFSTTLLREAVNKTREPHRRPDTRHRCSACCLDPTLP
jgi:hypothetical protein